MLRQEILQNYLPMNESGYYILLSLYKGKKHGYAINLDIKEMTGGSVQLGNGTLYGFLNRVLRDALVITKISDDKKIYELTELGREVLFAEKERLERLIRNFPLKEEATVINEEVISHGL